MNTKLIYGCLLAFAGIMVRLIGYLTELDGTHGAKATIGAALLGILGIAMFVAILWFGICAVRNERPDPNAGFSYGRAFSTGVLITLIAAIIGAIYTVIHIVYIDPDAVERTLAAAREQLENKNLSQEQIEMQLKWQGTFMNPVWMAIISFLGNMVLGVIVSLILAAMAKRKRIDPVTGAQMP